jgi:UDP-glucose 4-epimerase
MGTTCVLTGVAGFVGSHLAERLLALGHRVVGVDNFATGHRANMAAFEHHPQFTFCERSVMEPGLLMALERSHPGIRHVFHLAAVVSVPYSVAHPEETLAVNHQATVALLLEARQLDCHTFVFAGSAAEYGTDERLPLSESYATVATHHLSPYGVSKFLASTAIAGSIQPCGIALRCFNIYGPRQDPSSPYSGVISRFMEKGCAHQALTIFGDGQQTRDFIYVADVVEAYAHAAGLTGPSSPQPVTAGVYNVATGQQTSVLELAGIIRDLTGNLQDLNFSPERPGDIRHSYAVVERLQEASGWTPQVSLREGLQETLAWARTSAQR